MQNRNSLKNAFVWMAMFFVGIFVCGSFVSCSKDDVTGHDNNGNATMSVKVEKHDTTPEGPTVILKDSVWGKVIEDSLIIVHDSLRDGTVFKTETASLGFSAKISRKDDERKTTVERIKKLDFSFEDAQNKQNGKLQFIGSQNGNDADGQSYTLDFNSEKVSKWGLTDVHFELVGTNTPEVENTNIEKKATDSIRIKSEMTWPLTVKVVNVPNLEGKTFSSSMLNKTAHERYISYGDAVLTKRDTTMTPTIGIWSTEWLLKVVETYRVNGQDSVAPAQTKKVTLVSTCGIDKNEDAFVSSLEYSHNFTSEKWSNWYSVKSADNSVSIEERKFERLGVGSNGIAKDEFATRSFVTEQKATVVFAGLTWNIPATEAKLTNVRHTFLEEASDLDGYSMLKFVDDEVASYAGATDGDNYKKLNSSCKLYLKVKDPELIDVIFSNASKKHTASPNKVKVTLKGKEKYDTGAESEDIDFGFEMDEIWEAVDTFYSKQTEYIYETTDTMRADGSVVKTAQTKTVKGGTWSFNKYEGYTFVPVKIDGKEFKVRWHFVVYEDFSFTYKKYSYDKFDAASYSYKAENDKLAQNTDLTTASLEVWNYTVDGIFTIEDATRTAEGTGRLDKALEEVVVTEGWDKFNFETDAKEYTDRVEYFLKWIREYSTGKKTSQEVKVVLKRNAEGSAYTITVENPQREIGSQSETSSYIARTESSSDIVISYDWLTSTFELPNYFDRSIEKSDIATFVDPTNVKVTKKNSKGEDVTIELPSFEHQLTSTVSELEKVSESDELVEYTYTRTWNWASTQCTSSVKSIGNINKVPDGGAGDPDFDLEIGSIFATVSRPSNRDAADITAYTYLLVSKDGTKCLPLGFYNGVITVDDNNGIVDYVQGMNSACYVKDEDKVVATTATLASGIIKYKDANGNMVDGGMFLTWQGAGFNDRGNDYLNHTGKYAPKAEKKGNVYVVTFEGTNVSYTFKGWDVQ